MRATIVGTSLILLLANAPVPSSFAPRVTALERIGINDNRAPAGAVRDGVLTLRLVAREGEWHPDHEDDPGIAVRAFAEEGKAPQIPGPMIRVTEGTTIHAFVRNAIADSTLIVTGLSTRGASSDTIRIRPGEVREIRFVAGSPGTYYYWGTTQSGGMPDRAGMDSQLHGAFVVDPRGTSGPARDRVLILGLWSPVPLPGGVVGRNSLLRFTINGRTWPNTERLSHAQGDSVRFRVINASRAVHPMHLHGFYFAVNSRGDGTIDSTYGSAGSTQMVVTERAAPGRTFSMTWVAERTGNWLFHCHDNYHVLRSAPLDGSALPAEHLVHTKNHALEMMGGLVTAIDVRPGGSAPPRPEGPARRQLQLTVRADTGGTEAEPAYEYALRADPAAAQAPGPLPPGPTIVLARGEPVAVTVVNRLREPTAVHWHGIELDSYYDGVADFSGSPGRIAPAIAPNDSFVARFTPPRAGTFMYHPHADEVRQQQAGLSGAIIVLEPGATFDPATDVVLLISVPRRTADGVDRVLLNGSLAPPAREWRVGQRYRLRLINIHTFRPSMVARLARDSALVSWRAIAKDGMDLPPVRATTRPAMQQVGNGEAFDFEFTSSAPGDLRFTVSAAAGPLLVEMPIHVRR